MTLLVMMQEDSIIKKPLTTNSMAKVRLVLMFEGRVDKKFFIAKDGKGNFINGKIVGEYF